MDTLWILEAHFSVSIRLKNSLRLPLEDDLFQFCWVNRGLFHLLHIRRVFGPDLVIKQTLASINDTTLVSALSKDFEKPLNDWNQGTIIATRDLMWKENIWTFHDLKRSNNMFCQLDFFTKSQIILEIKINIIITTCD